MTGFTGIYLHGFLSSAMSAKGQWFKHKVEQSSADQNGLTASSARLTELLTPSYQISSPQLSAKQLDEVIAEVLQSTQNVILIGSSMGAFYARYFAHKYRLPYIMINPAFNVVQLFNQHLGRYQNPVTKEFVEINDCYINALSEFEINEMDCGLPSLLLVDKDDEVIDVDYALQIYQNELFTRHQTIVYSGGDHSFIHLPEAWSAMQNFIKKL
ncbi:YqiA/YcfP family alpha/beta fold hydrolase [Thiomicrorhabdus sediminis]|uniref:Esterase YqiA n=1 Tax=Thiomicrorhabdus sediminis TaxID=2580412 RepID=A0A4P9K7D2_9GAMM|nr:YqiA/YcfP family alpha/beta fold hydrolase [Thiomicrorhabdus sediminis]QCU90157.1 hypothetical protein FE785_05705 [Thiomicrorhabdus sediminis]